MKVLRLKIGLYLLNFYIFRAMENWLSGKTILITGGTSGLGKSLVYEFLGNGCHVISIARNGAVVEINNEKLQTFF